MGAATWRNRGRGRERGAEAIETPDQHEADVVQMAKIMRGGEGDAVKEICLGGCIRPSKVCGGFFFFEI